MTGKLRITGGTRRGRKLESPPANSIRPASDLVRQAVFNMLAGNVDGATFYDVFAGTGVVGLEALSRGAREAVFVERDRRQAQLLQRNIERTGFKAESSVRVSDAFLWGRHFVTDSAQVNIIFLGPPYPEFDSDRARMLELVQMVQEKLGDQDILVFQFPRFVDPDVLPQPDGWYRMRHYGKTRVGLWQRGAAAEAGEGEVADEEQRVDADDSTDEQEPVRDAGAGEAPESGV